MLPALRAVPAALALSAMAVLPACSGLDVSDQPGGQTWIEGDGTVTFVMAGERKAAPKVAGESLEDRELDVREHRGDVVVLNFWASWCPPCRAEARGLDAVFEQTQASGVQFVGVNMRDNRNAARRFAEVRDMSFPSLYDPGGSVVARFRGTLPPVALPSTIVLDRQGRIAVRVVGPITGTELRPLVERVAGEPA